MTRRLACALLVLLAASSVAMADDSDACWEEGYQKGWCDGRGMNECLEPLPPLPPLPPLGREDCKSRFADGYRAGLAAGNRRY